MQPSEIEQQLRNAQQYISSGRLRDGARICEQILAAGHEHPEALYLLAVVSYHAGNDEEVAHLLRRAMALRPDDVRFHGALGGYFRTRGRNREALDCFRRAVQLEPDSAVAWRAVGETLLAMDALDEAAAVYQNLLKVAPDDHAALSELGSILLEQGKSADAAKLLEKALSRHKDDAVAMARLGSALADQGRLEEARSYLVQAIAQDPELHEAYKTLGDLAHAEGRLEEAMEHYQKHLEGKHSLVALAQMFRTDKWGSHYYAQHYHKHFFPLRNREVNLLEIGVGGYSHPLRGGASLRMWKAFFPKGNIFSIDVHDKSAIQEDRIRIFRGSQDDPAFLERMVAEIGRLDIVIDDGSHMNRHVKDSFNILFPHLAIGGVYAVEDTQTSYWPAFGGNSADVNHPDSSLPFFKGLTDGLNYEELLLPGRSPGYFEQHIISMQFYHNMVFIHKGENNEGSNLVRNGVLLL